MPDRIIKKGVVQPFERFVQLESSSGLAILIAAGVAIILANSPWSHTYHEIWEQKITVRIFDLLVLDKTLHHWISDGLMTVFFFVIGLEIKRELLVGELNTVRKATLPIFAAIGGMLFPILFFLLTNQNPESRNGWGIVMATDIAFALAIVKLLGDRVPLGLKVLITAFAIVDDLGAILVVAAVYSESISWTYIVYAFIILAFLFFLSARDLYNKYFFIIMAVVVWVLFLKSGLHSTIAGVFMALTIPIGRKANVRDYHDGMQESLSSIIEDEGEKDGTTHLLSKKQIESIDTMEVLTEEVSSPLQHLEHKLHGWVAYIVMPLFALANAGVAFKQVSDSAATLAAIIAGALVIGNCIGVTSLSLLAVKLKVADLPDGVTVRHIVGISMLAGVGFTMSIFITGLAYQDPDLVKASKLGVLGGSLIAGLLGYSILRSLGNKQEA